MLANIHYISYQHHIGNDEISPNSFVDAPVAEMWSKEYLFMSCISYINKVKNNKKHFEK